jgi:predicted nuclease with TOPRIM domain
MEHLRERLQTLTSPENQEMSELNALADELSLEVSERIDRFQDLQSDIRSIKNRSSSLEERKSQLEDEISEIERNYSEKLKSREESLMSEIDILENEKAAL